MTERPFSDGVVYTETVVYSPPEQFAADAPYQIAILDLDSGQRITARIITGNSSNRAQIGDRVSFVALRDEVPYYASSRGGD